MTTLLINCAVCYEKNITVINTGNNKQSLLSPHSETPNTQKRHSLVTALQWFPQEAGNHTYSHN